ncbi:hypothetical protein [Paucidesulfovibrio gracilis]|nr:hypothetical protein [Paucidesulfovibrio gracilis]
MVDQNLGLYLLLHIHALMQDSDDRNCPSLNAVEDEMLPNGMTEVSFFDMITISADADILSDQTEGLIESSQVLLAAQYPKSPACTWRYS